LFFLSFSGQVTIQAGINPTEN